VIGMPLVAGMNTRELAGVLAHELGHFSQRMAMRLTYLMRIINGWFLRVVYHRDAWDEWLANLSDSDSNAWIQIIFLLAKLCVFLTRMILFVLFLVAHAISAFMLRQMEFNADRYQARLAGSDCFQPTMRRIHDLSAAAAYVDAQLPQARMTGRLADDLPELILQTCQRMPDEVRRAIDKQIQSDRTGLLDSHPSPSQRLARATAQIAIGAFRVQQPARLLFRNYAVLCKWTTIGHYQAHFGKNVDAAQLVPDERDARDDQITQASRDAYDRVLQNIVRAARVLVAVAFEARSAIDTRLALAGLIDARRRVEQSLPAAR
jgi:hypothetical protein